MNNITIYNLSVDDDYYTKREQWYCDRVEGLTFKTNKFGEKAAEEAFEITNAPEDCLTEEQLELVKSLNYKGRSLSVGDIVRVEVIPKKHSTPADYYLCKSFGWEKFEGDVIGLIKHLT